MNKTNLDKIAQDKARKMLETPDKEILEKLVTKTLGVLQSQGAYAMMLFLFSRTSRPVRNLTSCFLSSCGTETDSGDSEDMASAKLLITSPKEKELGSL